MREIESASKLSRRVALIGHSGAGKTACLNSLGIDPKTADMDEVLPTRLSESDDQARRALNTALDWLASSDAPEVVAVRNDEKMLYAMQKLKFGGALSGRFDHLVLVYLHTSREEIKEHLKDRKNTDANEYTLNNYQRFHVELYSALADRTVECAGKSVEEVAADVSDIAFGC